MNGNVSGPSYYGWFDSLDVGGNLTNNGNMTMGSSLNVAGNMLNAGSLTPFGVVGFQSGFSVGGTLLNTGSISWGDYGDSGSRTFLGSLINHGSIYIADATTVNTGSTGTDIPKSASWEIAGSLPGAFAHLQTIEGTIDIQNAITIGSPGNTIRNSGSFTQGTSLGGIDFTTNVIGNFSNSGNVLIGEEGAFHPDFGPSTLSVSGTFTNLANGTLNINYPPYAQNPSPGSLNAQKLVNYGLTEFQAGTTSSAQQLINYGTLNIWGDQFDDIGQLSVKSLTTAGGSLTVYTLGGRLVVGSGTVPSGSFGYYQFADGIFNAAGGGLEVDDPVSLNGTLDIMLGNGYKPVGTVFNLLFGGQITGRFANIEGLVFDDGRERYVVTYGLHEVTATVESNATPEPNSLFLGLTGGAGLILCAKRKLRRLSV